MSVSKCDPQPHRRVVEAARGRRRRAASPAPRPAAASRRPPVDRGGSQVEPPSLAGARQPRAAHLVGELADRVGELRRRPTRRRGRARRTAASNWRASASLVRHLDVAGERALEAHGRREPAARRRRLLGIERHAGCATRSANCSAIGGHREGEEAVLRHLDERRPRSASACSANVGACRDFSEDIAHHLRAERLLDVEPHVEVPDLLAARRRAVGGDDDPRAGCGSARASRSRAAARCRSSPAC